jgi:rubrerythrin
MCIKVLQKALAKENITIDDLEESAPFYTKFILLFDQLSSLPSWGNARDVITISKDMIRMAIENSLSLPQQGPGQSIKLSTPDALARIAATLKGLRDRSNLPQNPLSHMYSPLAPIQPPPMAAPPVRNISAIKQATKIAPPEPPLPEPVQDVESLGRDPGVTDAVWRQLQADKAAEIEAQKQREEVDEKIRQELREAEDAEARAQGEIAKVVEEARSADESKREDIMRKLEEERLREAAARAERASKAAELKAREEAQRLERQREAQAQSKLRQMGICPAGFRWVKQAGGYRCQAGGHFITDSQLGF